jgi:amidase
MPGPVFIRRLKGGPGRPRLAVKDLIDVAGVPTTAGSRLVARTAAPATRDAACIAGARQAGATIVGKTNLVELAFGTDGINPWFGTPPNPLDPSLVPGGSSSGSAVAVATGEADVAYGTDTGGSIRIPAACCGTAGLKTTHGRISTDGVWPLAPSLDTVGPMAASVAGLVTGMCWLERGFTVGEQSFRRLGRLHLGSGTSEPGVDPHVEAAIDAVLRVGGFEMTEVVLPGWAAAWRAGIYLLEGEAARSNHHLVGGLDQLDPAVAARLRRGARASEASLAEARDHQRRWRVELAGVLAGVDALVFPTLVGFPPSLESAWSFPFTFATGPVNLAGLPALALPVPGARLPASLQLVGPANSEEALLATGSVLESAAASLS